MSEACPAGSPREHIALHHPRWMIGRAAGRVIARAIGGWRGLMNSIDWTVRCNAICQSELRRNRVLGPNALARIFGPSEG